MRALLIVYITVFISAVTTVYAAIEITGADAVFDMDLTRGNLSGNEISVPRIDLHGVDVIWTRGLSNESIQLKPPSVKRIYIHDADLLFTTALVSPEDRDEKLPLPSPNSESIATVEKFRVEPVEGTSTKPFTGQRWAVVIGISDYKDPGIPDLRYADKDAQAFFDFLTTERGGGFDYAHTRLLLNVRKQLT